MTRNQDIDESDPTKAVHDRQDRTGPGQQIARELARWWLAQADINAGGRAGGTSAEQPEIVQLRAEIKRLREDNEVLKAATVLFAGELDPRDRLGLISS